MAQKKRKRYELVDILIILLADKLKREVNRLDVMGFDELSAPRVITLTTAMVTRLLNNNKDAYIKIAKSATEEAADDLKEEGINALPLLISGKYIDKVLNEYNSTTNYLYYPEADRKRARLAEALLTAIAVNSRNDYHKELKRFADLWNTQTTQYGDTIVDKTRIETFKKYGINYVRWQTQEDEKVCKECKDRNGKIYPITDIPDKHYNCRCWLISVPDKKKGSNGES